MTALQRWLGKFVTMKCNTLLLKAFTELKACTQLRCAPDPVSNKEQILEAYFQRRQFMMSCLQKY